MLKLARLPLIFILILIQFTNVTAKLTLEEIRTASNDVIVLYFTSDSVDINEININDINEWKINGKPVDEIFRFASEADKCDHFVYLKTSVLEEGKQYIIETPYTKTDFVFTEKNIFCESIKTNQAAYSALSDVRYANFAIWIGTGGSRKIEGELPGYEVINVINKESVIKGNLKEYGFDTSSGDFVYRINLANVPEGGPYKIVVKGYGSSYPFGIGGEFSKQLAYITFRGQYMQRCGCPIENPPIRKKACHTMVYDTDGPIGEANVEVQGDEPVFKCYGGYHDAGDADRRAYHMINPIVNLMIYEAFPQTFYDGQYDIPGKFDDEYNIVNYRNEIPDILDEANWGTLVWEYLQNEDGSIHFGTETKGYPDPFDAPMDHDDKKYGTVKADPRATCTGAGLFMHLARLMKPYNDQYSNELLQRAEKAYQYGNDDMADPERLYFHIQKYLLTGNQEDHQKIKELYKITDSLKHHQLKTPGYSLNDIHFDNPAYFFSYIIEKDKQTDPDIVNFFRKVLKETADSSISMLKAHAYPVSNPSDKGGWGHNVKQPQYATACLLYWSLTKEQKYVDAASEMMDWKLGLNPSGISYVTGLGFHRVHNPHDRESAYTKKMGWGNKPGITVFGPGVLGWWHEKSPVFPKASELPKERQFVDDLRAIYFTEFTIFETMSHDAFYTILAEGGKWNGEDPYTTGK